ncbi:hypothetical protein WMF30_01400 [Sorangium sp. So ce134]
MYTHGDNCHVCATHDAGGYDTAHQNFLGWDEAGSTPSTLPSTNRLGLS